MEPGLTLTSVSVDAINAGGAKFAMIVLTIVDIRLTVFARVTR